MAAWTDLLPGEVWRRLAECRSRKADLPILLAARWRWYQESGRAADGLGPEDALVDVLDLLDSNSQYVDLTCEEYDALLAQAG